MLEEDSEMEKVWKEGEKTGNKMLNTCSWIQRDLKFLKIRSPNEKVEPAVQPKTFREY